MKKCTVEHCNGDMFLEGNYYECLLCGYKIRGDVCPRLRGVSNKKTKYLGRIMTLKDKICLECNETVCFEDGGEDEDSGD